jgi:mRNA-degrading endonuclease RelE of RelBE toxin-antitoxin system
MTPLSSVRPAPRFGRLARRLTDQHPQEFPARYAEAIEILTADPTNRTGRYRIKKLEGVAPGDGQWRLRLGRFRFLYDIVGSVVELAYCGLRREDTYRNR